MKRILFVCGLLLVLLFSFTACGAQTADANIDTETPIKIMVLNGPTGFGAAQLLDAADKGETDLNYEVSVESDATAVTTALVSGDVDIAALSTNAAATVYNKTGGKVSVVAVNTMGVLYLTERGKTVQSFADLKGKTVYVPGQGSNPQYITEYLCEANGLKVGTDVTLDFSYNAPADLRTALVAGDVELAVLPEPMVTVAETAGPNIHRVLNFTYEWKNIAQSNSLMQGCIVAAKDFIENHPAELAAFLADYQASVAYVCDNAQEAGKYIAEQGLADKAEIASKAIPGCNLCCLTGAEMQTGLSEFLQVLFDANPQAVGGEMPKDDFYYIQ